MGRWGRSRTRVRKDREGEQHQPQGLGRPQTSGAPGPSSAPSICWATTGRALVTPGPGSATAGEGTLPRFEMPGEGLSHAPPVPGQTLPGGSGQDRGRQGQNGEEGRPQGGDGEEEDGGGRRRKGMRGGLVRRQGNKARSGGGRRREEEEGWEEEEGSVREAAAGVPGTAPGRAPPAGTPLPWDSLGPPRRRDTGEETLLLSPRPQHGRGVSGPPARCWGSAPRNKHHEKRQRQERRAHTFPRPLPGSLYTHPETEARGGK